MTGCRARQKNDQMTCACGQAWDMNDENPPECLDFLESQLRALLVDESFITPATPLDVITVWSDKINTYGLELQVSRVKGGASVKLLIAPHNDMPGGLGWDGVAFCLGAAFGVFCMGFVIGGGMS